MAEERIKGVGKARDGRPQPREADAPQRGDELSREELEQVAGGAAFAEQKKKSG